MNLSNYLAGQYRYLQWQLCRKSWLLSAPWICAACLPPFQNQSGLACAKIRPSHGWTCAMCIFILFIGCLWQILVLRLGAIWTVSFAPEAPALVMTTTRSEATIILIKCKDLGLSPGIYNRPFQNIFWGFQIEIWNRLIFSNRLIAGTKKYKSFANRFVTFPIWVFVNNIF